LQFVVRRLFQQPVCSEVLHLSHCLHHVLEAGSSTDTSCSPTSVDSPRREDLGSNSDSDEELPVFDFLKPRPSTKVASQKSPKKRDLNYFHAKPAAVSSSVLGHAASADVMMISSDSEDDVPYVPLAQRLKLRPAIADLTERNISNVAGSQACCQKGSSDSEHLLTLRQERRTTPEELDDLLLRSLSASTSPTRKTATKRTAEEVRASREEALRRRQARERQQQDKEVLKQEQERQKAERKALAEATKALRPEECIKHMVVAVDPGERRNISQAKTDFLECRPMSSVTVEKGSCSSDNLINFRVLNQYEFCSIFQEERHSRSDCSPTLTTWVQGQQRRHPDKNLSLAVIELENYFRYPASQRSKANLDVPRAQKSHSHKRFREAVAGEETGGKEKKKRRIGLTEKLPEVSRVDVEEVG
ncbi:hypothetical protein GOODEAATRI_010482, partial [Goodea atripinnis]